MTSSRLAKLTYRVSQQIEFSRSYGPLYARLWGVVHSWFTADDVLEDALVQWLLAAGAKRTSFDVPLLLVAGIHRDVLAGEPAMATLARYYPTVGGEAPFDSPEFEKDLRVAIMARREALAEFIQTRNVQTNETGRGLIWLLPLHFVPWPTVRLVDLGASAGLNLVADRRSFELFDEGGGLIGQVGDTRPGQFSTICTGDLNDITNMPPTRPQIVGRLGCDISPLPLRSKSDELTLMSYVWGDQPHRLARLREAIAAFKQVEQEEGEIVVYPAGLPDDLPQFLQQIPTDASLVLYNTYITQYLSDKGASLFGLIGEWAQRIEQPIMWLQWEPARDGSEPPEFGWLAWSAVVWLPGRGKPHHTRIGWVHPHGTHARFEKSFRGIVIDK